MLNSHKIPQILSTVDAGLKTQTLGTNTTVDAGLKTQTLGTNTTHNDDEIIITESPHVLDMHGRGCLIRAPDLSCIKYMAHRLEIRDITLGTLTWIPEWILEVYLENCRILETTADTNLPQSVIKLTCRNCHIDNPKMVYQQLVHHRLVRLELIGQGLIELPSGLCEYAPNLLFLNLNNNELSCASKWPKKVRGLRLTGNKLTDLAQLGPLPPYLEDLDLSNNLFAEIPVRELSPHLRKLNMSNNNLQWLPEDHTDYPPNLRELNIADNCGLNDLTDVAFPDMLSILNASGCEIEKLPHDWEYTCLQNLDLSDNNITNLDELPTAHVLNINYIGNPCWVESSMPSRDLSPSGSDAMLASSIDGFIDDDPVPDNISLVDSSPNSVFTSGSESPTHDTPIRHKPISPIVGSPTSFKILYSSSEDDYTVDTGIITQSLGTDGPPILRPPGVGLEFSVNGMNEYKEAISRSSSEQSLQNIQNQNQNQIYQIYQQECNPYPVNDPLVKAIDYVLASGLRRVESFFCAMTDILSPADYPDDDEFSLQKKNIPAGHVLDDMDSYGILGSFD